MRLCIGMPDLLLVAFSPFAASPIQAMSKGFW